MSKPEPVTVEEGDWSRFCCRVTGHPRPRVMWIINGHTVVNVSFAIPHLSDTLNNTDTSRGNIFIMQLY